MRLLFASEVATYIRERVWHASQELRERRDGALEFRLQTSSRKELTRWILPGCRTSRCSLRANSGTGCGNGCVRDWLAADDPHWPAPDGKHCLVVSLRVFAVQCTCRRRDQLPHALPVEPDLRARINNGETRFFDMHLSMLPQTVRYGFGPVHWAVVEACDVTDGGGIVLTTSVGASPTFCRMADKILIELNRRHPPTLLGMHDIYEPADPPHRREIPIYSVSDRIGSPLISVDPSKIVGVVETELDDDPVASARRTR